MSSQEKRRWLTVGAARAVVLIALVVVTVLGLGGERAAEACVEALRNGLSFPL